MTDTRKILKEMTVSHISKALENLWILSNPRIDDYHDVSFCIDQLQDVIRRIAA